MVHHIASPACFVRYARDMQLTPDAYATCNIFICKCCTLRRLRMVRYTAPYGNANASVLVN